VKVKMDREEMSCQRLATVEKVLAHVASSKRLLGQRPDLFVLHLSKYIPGYSEYVPDIPSA
jgi:hypothetical protein